MNDKLSGSTPRELAAAEAAARAGGLAGLFADWYWVLDRELRYVHISGQGDQRNRVNAASLIGQLRFEGREFEPLDMTKAEFERLHAQAKPYRDVRARIGIGGGSHHYIAISGEPLLDASGTLTGYHGVTRDITQAYQTQAALAESEARFRSLIALSSDFYWESDREHRITVRTGGGARSLDQVGGGAIFGKRRWELDTVAPDAAGWDAHRADLEARRTFRGFEFAWVGADGKVYHLSISGEPVFDAGGGFAGYRGIGSDNSARRREEQLVALEHAVAQGLTEARDATQAVERVMRAVCEVTGFDCARYFRMDAADGVMRQAAGWSADPGLLARFVENARKREFKPGEGVVGEVWRSGNPLWIGDIANDPRFINATAAGGASLRTGFTVPITYDGRIEGVLSFLSVRLHPEDPVLLRTVRAVASQLAQFLGRARSQEQLRENEERFRSLTELSSDWYWEQDAELRFVTFSGGSIPRKWGVDQMNAIGKRRDEIPGVVAVSCSWEAHQADLDARKPYRDFIYMRVHRETGQTHYVSASGYPLFDAAGRFIGYRGVATDVTERVRVERLREMEHRVSGLLAAGEDAAGTLEAVIRTVCETHGIDCGRYFEADEYNEFLHFAGGWSVAEEGARHFLEGSRATRFRRGDRVSGAVWEQREAIWVADVTLDPRTVNTPVAGSGMRSMLGVPVVSGGRAVGTLSFTSRQMRAPDQSLLHALTAIGGQLGQFLGRARSQDALRESNALLEMHARQQKRIAEFGQFALKRHGEEELIAAALRALGDEVERMVFFERDAEGRLRLRQGLGPEVAESVGRTAPVIPGGAAGRVLDGGEAVRVDGDYFTALPEDMPWSGWLRRMQSGVFVPVTHDGHAHGMLALFDSAPGAFEEDDLHFAESVANVLSAALQREQAEQRLSHMAQFDALTGLPNRTLLEDRLRQTMAQSRRKHWQTGVLFVDLDRFKLVNDTLGHPVGDRLLREVAQRLAQCVRADDTVGRISGDEFAVVIADLARPEDAGVVAQKILEALARPFALDASETFISASIGISVFPADGEDADTLLRNADMAMYRAKKGSRNAYRFFTAKMNDRTVRKLELHTDLRHAVERREFSLHYQPKVELARGALTGMEALLRWNHPRRGAVSPAEFIPALEESGLILPVGEWVLEEACAQQKRWRESGLAPVPVAINLSPKQFRKRDLDRVIQDALAAAGLPPGLLELEITESSIADDPEDAVRILKNLRAAGMTVSVDDFGTGYSSLAYLTRLPISALKIDRSFVRDAETSPEAVSIVRAVIDMAHNMRFTVVAEGVETEWQAKFLRLYNCDQAQGYLYGRPVPAAQIEGRLAKAGG
ncbi:MAG: EAL domain-containing protein [Betaproteobacteria bacterium]